MLMCAASQKHSEVARLRLAPDSSMAIEFVQTKATNPAEAQAAATPFPRK